MKPDDERDQTTDTDAGSVPDRETTQRTSETRRPWIIAILGAVIGGMTAWGVAESPIGRFTPEQSNLRVMGMATGSKAATPEAIREAERLNAVRSIGVFGAMVGLGMGIASGARLRRQAIDPDRRDRRPDGRRHDRRPDAARRDADL